MNIWDIDKFALFLLFFVPGFISVKVYDLFVPHHRRDFSNCIFEVIGYSTLNFVAFSWLIVLMHSRAAFTQQELLYWLCLLLIVILAPIGWPIAFLALVESRYVARFVSHPWPKPWDFVFKRGESYWVVVHLKDGRKVGGRFDTRSFASSFPEEEQIYLEEVWRLDKDGRFEERVKDSAGTILGGSHILAVEFFKQRTV